MTVGAVVAQLRLDMTNFKEGMAKANSLLEQHAQYAGRAATMLGGFAMAAAGAAVVAVKMAAEMETALTDMNKVLNLTEKQLAAVSDDLHALARATGIEDEKLAGALANIGKAGYLGAAGMQILESATRAAVAGGAEMSTVADALVVILRAYNLAASESTKITDTLYQASLKARMPLGEVAGAIKGIVPVASQLGIGYDQLAAALATMVTVGYDAENSLMGLNMVMIRLTNPSAQLKAALQAAGYESGQALIQAKGLAGAIEFLTQAAGDDDQAMIQMAGGARAFKAVAALAADGGRLFAQKLVEVGDAAGSVNDAFARTERTFRMQWSQFIVTIKQVGEEVGNVLLPAFTGFARLLRTIATGFKVFAEASPVLRTLAVAVVGLAAAFAGLTASVILYNTQIKASIPLVLGMLSATKQMVVALAATPVTLAMVTGSLTLLANAARGAWAAVRGINLMSLASGSGLLALAAAGYAVNAGLIKAAGAMRTTQDELTKLVDKASKAGMVLPVGLYQNLQPPPMVHFVSGMREALGMAPLKEIEQARKQQEMLRHLVELNAELATTKVQAEEDAGQRLKALRQSELANALEVIEKERVARIRAGVDEQTANDIAFQEIASARQRSTAEALKLEAQVQETEGKTHQARITAILAETAEWRAQQEKILGKDKAADVDASVARFQWAKFRELAKQEAEARAQAFEKAADEVVSSWLNAADQMRQADQITTAEHLDQLTKVHALIEQINAARTAAGQQPLFSQEDLQLAQTIFSERKRMQTELEAGEKSLAAEHKQWTQEELDQRRQLNEYELAMVDLTFQHRRDLAKVTGREDEQTSAQIAQQELAALQQRRATEDLGAQARLDSLERERNLILQISEAGNISGTKATTLLGDVFDQMKVARAELAAQDQAAFDERRQQHDETLKQIDAEQKTLRTALADTGGRITQVAQSVFDVIEQRIRALGSIRLEPAMAGAGGGGRTYNIRVDSQTVAASPLARKAIEDLIRAVAPQAVADDLEGEILYRRD